MEKTWCWKQELNGFKTKQMVREVPLGSEVKDLNEEKILEVVGKVLTGDINWGIF